MDSDVSSHGAPSDNGSDAGIDELAKSTPTEKPAPTAAMDLQAMEADMAEKAKAQLEIDADRNSGPDGMDEHEMLLASQAGFPAHGKMGLKFSRSASGGQNPDYKTQKLTHEQKGEFRKAWAAAQSKEMKVGKEKTTAW